MHNVILAIVASASALATQATAAQEQTGGAPTEAAPMTIVYPDKGPSGMSDLPMGAHRIPDSNVIISGHQKGGALGSVFGIFGILVQSAANADAGKGAVRNVQDELRFDVAAKAADMTQTIMAGEKYRQKFTLSPNAGGGTLSVVPYVVITFVNETDARPYVVLKTTLSSGSPGGSRMIKYFCCEGKALPLAGENGLSANNGERLKEVLMSELETAIQVMLLDRSQPYSRDNRTKIAAKGYFPFVGKPIKLKGYDIGRYNDHLLFEIPGGSVFGGVNIAEQSSLEIEAGNAK
ncbi:MAG: hypothetical protein P0Y59_10270 [Candidatus Sphingomonas phytovorans]|nr:hypothetical protein [Sphingomonas sp.]WEK02037.1 MAG: hypothetical protein P0Y59_10270 [Sphingomonas sp.]